jgi:hypothetical protein
LGLLIGAPLWFIHPMTGFKASLYPSNLFFQGQMALLMRRIRNQLQSLDENERTILPITYGLSSSSFAPHHNMHATYLIVEKKNSAFNLYWVNRPNVTQKEDLKEEDALVEIRSMFDARFPFMDIEKMMNYPVESQAPQFLDGKAGLPIAQQGNSNNCVVSNLFGTLEVFDRLQQASLLDGRIVSAFRYSATREALMHDYSFYQKDFFFFAPSQSLSEVWPKIEASPHAPI